MCGARSDCGARWLRGVEVRLAITHDGVPKGRRSDRTHRLNTRPNLASELYPTRAVILAIVASLE